MAMFISKKRELRLIVKPADRTFDEARRPIIIRGERVEFLNYRYKTEDPGLIAWLKQHYLYGTGFICADDTPTPAPMAPPIPMLIEGTSTTANKTVTKEGDTVVEVAPLHMSYETPITKDEIDVMIDQKLDAFLGQITHILQSQNAVKEPAPKRTFKCPHCEEVFKSGIEVGKHKKRDHADKL